MSDMRKRLVPVEAAPATNRKRLVPVDATPRPSLAAETATAGAGPTSDPAFSRPPMESFEKGAASVGRGLADVAGFPVDMLSLGMNTAMGVGDMLGLGEMPYIEKPVMGSDWIAEKANQAYEFLGGEVLPDEALSPVERIVQQGVRFGTGAAVPAAGMAQKAKQGADAAKASGFLDMLAKPYQTNNAGRVVAGDAVAGAGSGIGVGTYEEVTPEEQQGPVGALLSAMVGGTGAATLNAVGQGLAGAGASGVRSMVGANNDPMVGPDPTTGYRPSRKEVEQAARIAQGQASDPIRAARTIEEGTAELDQFASRGAQPTAGALSDDVGLAIAENAQRTKDPKPFIERDRAVSTRARDVLDETAPANADARDFTDYADRTMSEQLVNIDRDAAARRAPIESAAAPADPLADYRGKGPDASRALDADFRSKLTSETQNKNDLYSDPTLVGADVSAEPIYKAATDLEKSLGPLSDPNSIPADIVGRIKSMAEVDPETGEVTGFVPMKYGDVQDLRAQVSSAISEARAASGRGESGSGPRVDNLRKLRNVLDNYIEDLAANGDETVAGRAQAAIGNYRDNFAPRFKQGQAGEFTRAVRADPTGARTRPEDTASKFLGRGKGDDTESLLRALDADNNPDAVTNARTYLMDRLSAIEPVDPKTGAIKTASVQKWIRSNAEVIKRVPGMKDEVASFLRKAGANAEASKQAADTLRQIDVEATTAKRAVEQGPLGLVAGKSPENAVKSVFGSGDPERQMQSLIDEVGSDTKARDGLKKAMTEYLVDKNTTTALEKTTDGRRPVSFAKLENFFNANADAISQVYTPEEMNALRAVHKMLKPFGNLRNRGTSGSDTAEKSIMNWRVMEAVLKARYGVLKGGGVLRTMRVAADTLPNNQREVDSIVQRMMFDPDLAVHLLRKEVKDVGTPEWNSKLNRLLAYGAAARENTEDE